eukprot:g699.t1
MSARWDVASLRTGESIPTSGGGAFAARSRHTAVAIGSDIYVFGGVKGGNDLFCLDTANDPLTWKVVKTTGRPPSSRLGHSATAFEDRMFLFGGTDGINDYNDLYEFSPKTGHWSELANIAGTAPKPSPNYSLHVLRNNLIVLGGSASDTCMSVFMVNLVGEKRWWELPSFRAPFDPPSCRYLYASTCLSSVNRQFGDLHYADLDVSFTWQINTGATISRSSTVVSPTEDVLPLQFPDVWPSARHGCTLTPVLSKQLQSQSSAHKAIRMFLLLGGSSLKSAKHVKSNAESSALSKKAYSDGAYVLCRGKVSDETSVGAETGAIPSRHDDLQWRAIKMSNSKSLHHSPLLKSGFHGHTVTPIYDEKSAFGPSNSHTSSFLVFGGLVNGTPGASALWHLSVDAAQLAQMLSSPSIGSDQGKWCTWKPVTLQSKSNKLGTTRMGHAAICFGRTLYIVGGYSDGAYQENSLALNTGSEKMRWRQLQNSAFARVGHSIVAYNESREEALMFGGTWKGEATNSLFTVYFAKEVVEKGNVVPKKGQHTRGETKLFVTQGGTPPSPRFGHSAVRLEPYEKSRSFLSARGAQGVKKGTITVGFDSDVDDDVTDAKHESHEQNYFGRSLKMMIVGGIVPSKVAKRKVSVCDQKDMYHEVMDIHILDLETLCWSTPLLLPSVDDSWRQVNYEYFCEILYNRAELDAKGKVSSNKSMKLAAKKKNDEGEDKAFGPSKDDMMRALNDASSNSELAKVALKAYKPLKRLYKSSSTSDQESSFYSTDSDAYASGADGGFYSSGEES